MESNYNSDNFERLLKESSDQYRMYPSESAWKNIYRALHTRRKWFGLGFLLLMLSAGFVTTIMLSDSPASTKQISINTAPSATKAIIEEQIEPVEQKTDVSITPLYKNNFPETFSPVSSAPLVETIIVQPNRLAEVVSIFPNESSCLRLVSALLREISEESETGNRYLPKTTIVEEK